MANRSSRHKGKSPKKWWKITLIVLLVLVLGVGGYAYSIYHNAKQTVNKKMFETVESIDHTIGKKKLKETKPLNILLLGIDTETGDKGRSDAIMVLSLKPKTNSMQLISIPRDTRTEIVGRGHEDKINHAYAFGGADMSIATVENLLDMDFDFFVSMNMSGLKELVDQLGGITVNNEIEWQDGKYSFTKGPTDMDGDKAMSFVRMRKQDPEGDFGRTKRQRKVIEGIIDKGASIASIPKISGTIDILGNNMDTNLDFDDMKKLLSGYSNTRSNMENYQMSGSGTTIDGIYYLIVPDEEIEKVKQMIAED